MKIFVGVCHSPVTGHDEFHGGFHGGFHGDIHRSTPIVVVSIRKSVYSHYSHIMICAMKPAMVLVMVLATKMAAPYRNWVLYPSTS